MKRSGSPHGSRPAAGNGHPHPSACSSQGQRPAVPFEGAKIIIEFNGTDQDADPALPDAEAWKNVAVLDPKGHKIFDVVPKGR